VIILALLMSVVGMYVSFSLSAVTSNVGYGLMIGGSVIALISFFFFSAFSRA
jgi:hypothetical protein